MILFFFVVVVAHVFLFLCRHMIGKNTRRRKTRETKKKKKEKTRHPRDADSCRDGRRVTAARTRCSEAPGTNETFVSQTLKTVDVFKRNDTLDEFGKDGTKKVAFNDRLRGDNIRTDFSQVQKLFATSLRTDLSVDHDMDPTMVTLTMSFPAINCEHLSVDLVDAVGHRAFNSERRKHL